MGGCLSKCVRKDTDVSEKWAEKRCASKESLHEFIGKGTDDAWSAEIDPACALPANQRIVVSPMNADDFAMLGEYHHSSKSRKTYVKPSGRPDCSPKTESRKEVVIDEPAGKTENGTSQPLNCEIPPKKKISRTRILQLSDNSFEEELEVVEVEDDDDEFEIPEGTVSGGKEDVVTHELEEMDYSWVESVAEKKRKKKAAQEPEVSNNNVNIVEPPKVPGVMVINVRPKTPEQTKIEFVPQPKVQNKTRPVVSVNNSQIVPKQTEIVSVGSNGHEDEDYNDPLAMETDSDVSIDSDDVNNNSDPILDGANGEIGGNGEPMVLTKKTKKMRPRKIYPYTRGRMIPQGEFPELPPWCYPEPTVKATKHWDKRNYEEFANRLLKPSQKAQATAGKVLDGTLITWPKFVNNNDKVGQPSKTGTETTSIGGRSNCKLAWANSPTPVLNTNQQLKPRGHSDTAKNANQPIAGSLRIIAKKNGHTEPRSLNEEQIRRFAYQPPEFFARPKAMPFFKEKKLTFHPSIQPEESDEDIDFAFTPENLRRYAKRRQEKLQRRPKTPFHRKPVGKGTKTDESDDATLQPATQKPEKSSDGTKLLKDSKCVSFVIPVSDNESRPPTSRPNTRRQIRPRTARANAEQLAQRQASAQKRRDQVMSNRGQGLKKKAREVRKEEVEKAKAEKLKEKMEGKMSRHRENKKKNIEEIVAKQTAHIKRVKHKHDVVFTRKRFMGLEKDTSPDPINVQFTINDIVEIDRFFDEMDSAPSSTL